MQIDDHKPNHGAPATSSGRESETQAHAEIGIRNTEIVYRWVNIHMTLTLHLIIEMHLYLLHEHDEYV